RPRVSLLPDGTVGTISSGREVNMVGLHSTSRSGWVTRSSLLCCVTFNLVTFTAPLAGAGPPGPQSVAPAATKPADQGFRIVVEPNLLVSRDRDVPHVETTLAINPKDPKNLLGAAMYLSRPARGIGGTCKTYASRDGGYTWVEASVPEA